MKDDTNKHSLNPLDAEGFEHKRSMLWRRRLFEAEAGLTRYVVELRSGAHLHSLVQLKESIFADLPRLEDEEGWKRVFFRGQALMEAYVVKHFSLEELSEWAKSNSAVYNAVDEQPKQDARVPLQRLKDQAELYGSDSEWVENSRDTATLHINHCAIWDYREKARARGVEITLDAPCEYCVPATHSMVRSKGLSPEHQLLQDKSSHGCIWTAQRSQESEDPS